MRSAEALPLVVQGEVFVPAWLGPADHRWIAAMVDALRRCEGEPERVWEARARESFGAAVSPRRQAVVARLLSELCGAGALDGPKPRALRARLFAEAQSARDRADFEREAVIARVAAASGVEPGVVMGTLYADLPGERPLALPDLLPGPSELCLRANASMVRGLLRSADRVDLRLRGTPRAVLRSAALRRLLVTARPTTEGVHLQISGPYAIFRRTTLYGRAVAGLLPALRAADDFVLDAGCTLRERPARVRIRKGDPIFTEPAPAPGPIDALQERFRADFAKLAPGWALEPEPPPVRIGDQWVFADFAVVHREDPARRGLIELVGFWTEAYLAAKLAAYARAGRRDVLLCVDARLGVGEAERPGNAEVIGFRSRIDASAVREWAERLG